MLPMRSFLHSYSHGHHRHVQFQEDYAPTYAFHGQDYVSHVMRVEKKAAAATTREEPPQFLVMLLGQQGREDYRTPPRPFGHVDHVPGSYPAGFGTNKVMYDDYEEDGRLQLGLFPAPAFETKAGGYEYEGEDEHLRQWLLGRPDDAKEARRYPAAYDTRKASYDREEDGRARRRGLFGQVEHAKEPARHIPAPAADETRKAMSYDRREEDRQRPSLFGRAKQHVKEVPRSVPAAYDHEPKKVSYEYERDVDKDAEEYIRRKHQLWRR